jgi:serine/threonine protein kinase/type 1 glutamine amidotransferase
MAEPPPEDPAAQPAAPELHGLDPGELLARGLNSVQPSAGGARWIPPTPEELAALLPQYRIEKLLGHGGMGAVYQGVQPTLDRVVAIKLLPAEMTGDAQFVARFQREARTLAKLQHPGIVAVYDFGQTRAGHLYFVMEFVDGTDLHRILHGPGMNSAQALELISQICDALHYAHRQGVIHRDIKPANILVAKDGRAKLADFGLARPVRGDDLSITSTNMVMGTPDYMAPEQRAGQSDHRADIFALGVMLYEMLTGQTPRGAFAMPSQRVRVDVRIDRVVLKALQQEPSLRYQAVSEMRSDVERIRTTPAMGSPKVVAKPKPARKSSGFASALIVVLAVIAGFLFWERGVQRGYFPPVHSTPASAVSPTPPESPAPVVTPAPLASAGSVRPSTPTPAPLRAPTPGAVSPNWRVPGLNDARFGGMWIPVGDPKLTAQDGILNIASNRGRSGIISWTTDFSKFDLHVELAGSGDVEAWVGVRVALQGEYHGYTSYVHGRGGDVVAGHAGRDFAGPASVTQEREGGMGGVGVPVQEFFSLDFEIRDDDSLWTKVNGASSSGVGRSVPPQGAVALFVSAGTLRVRKIEIRDRTVRGTRPVATPTPTPAPVVTTAPATTVRPSRVLFLTYSAGFQHSVVRRNSADYSLAEKQLMMKVAATGGFSVEPTQMCGAINRSNLRNFGAVAFYTSGELPIDTEGKRALLDFVRDGGGFVGIHSATDTFYNFPEYGALLGGYLDAHPAPAKAWIRVDDRAAPATAHLGDSFQIMDEAFQFRSLDREQMHVLLSIDPRSVPMMRTPALLARRGRLSDEDYPVAWTRSYGQGRVFYTALGHSEDEWTDDRFLKHVAGGIQWALTAPRPVPPAVPAPSAVSSVPPAPLPPGTTFARALTSSTWNWVNLYPGYPPWTARRFTADGVAAAYVGATLASTGRWQFAGPRSIKVVTSTGTQFLTFDPTFSTFDGTDEQGIRRFRGARQ